MGLLHAAPLYPQASRDHLIGVKKYQKQDGLSHNQVQQVFQDSRGFHWIITRRGLDMFDGNRFYAVLEWTSLYGYRTAMIRTEDSRGYLWIRILEPEGCRFIRVSIRTRANWPLEVNIQKRLGPLKDVARDSLGHLWYLTQSGAIWKEDGSGSLRKLATGFSTYMFAQQAFRKGLIWLHEETYSNTTGITYRLIALGSKGEKVFKRDIPKPLQFEFFRELENVDILRLDMEGILLRERTGQLREVSIPKSIFGSYEESTPEFVVYEVGQGEKHIYIWQTNQLYLLIYGSDWTFLRGHALGSTVFSIPGGLNIIRDRIGEIWIGSLDGLYKISLRPRRFKRYLWLEPENTDKYFSNSVRGIKEGQDGSMYFMCGPALYRKLPGNEVPVKVAAVGAISGIEITRQSGDLYFRNEGLIRYDPGSGNLKRLPLPGQIPLNTFAWSLFDTGDRLWIGDDMGLWTYNPLQNKSQIFESYNGFEGLRRSEKFHIAKKNDQELFVLTNKGLFVLDRIHGVTAAYGDHLKGKFYLPAQVFYHLSQTRQGTYWLATSNGLLYWDVNKGQVKRYTTAEGLPSNAVLAVYVDGDGMLWLNTEEGIAQFNPISKSCRIFLESDGIAHNEGNRIAHGKAEDGTIYFGGLNGVTAFHPKDFADKNKKPEKLTLLLTDAVTYNGNQASERNILSQYVSQGGIYIKASDNSLNIQVAAVSNRPSQERFEYIFRFKGLGNRWFVAEKGAIKLTNPPFGTNVLEVRAVSSTGGDSGFLNIPIRVKRPFYLTIWFIGLVTFFAALIFYGWLRYRTASLVQRSKELEAEVLRRTEKIQEDKVVIEQQARELIMRNADKNRFFANVTHEFRTPLALILGPLQSLKKRARAHTRDAQLLDIAYRNASRLVDMVDDILMLSVLEMRHLKVLEVDFSPGLLLGDILEEYALQADQKGISLSFDSRVAATDYLRSDQRFLRIILNNLLSNAFKFTPKGGKIQLELFRKASHLHLVVRDSGRGIHPEDLPHVFERFFQTKQVLAPAEGGSGIGLALCAELSALLGGQLKAQSQYGHGATFELILPWRAVDTKTMVSSESEGGTSKPGKSRKGAQKKLLSGPSEVPVLVVEDNPDMQRYLRFILEDDYQVTTAFSGREAIELIENGLAPALILSDYMMPEMDGLQLLAYLRKNVPVSQFIPFVMLTARAGQENRETALLLAVDDYLLKPFDARALQIVVAELISRYQTRKSEAQKITQADTPIKMPPLEEQAWLEKLQKETLRLIESHTFSVDQLAAHMLMGRTNFFNEVKRLTGLTPNQYVLELRLLRARKLIEDHPESPLRDIVAQVGLRDERYFVRVFKNRFGQSPEYFR
jgi:signal transduction histidine kinase/CheY-like chemotaxis protein/AraC-like DNA-binding protein